MKNKLDRLKMKSYILGEKIAKLQKRKANADAAIARFEGAPELKCPSCGSTKLIKNDASGVVTCLKCRHKTDTYEALKQGEKPSQPADDGLDSGE